MPLMKAHRKTPARPDLSFNPEGKVKTRRRARVVEKRRRERTLGAAVDADYALGVDYLALERGSRAGPGLGFADEREDVSLGRRILAPFESSEDWRRAAAFRSRIRRTRAILGQKARRHGFPAATASCMGPPDEILDDQDTDE